MKFLFLFTFFGVSLMGQNISIHGSVRDENRLPLMNVVIKEKNTNQFSYSNESGEYSISVSKGNSILQFYYYGKIQKEISIKNYKNHKIDVIIPSQTVKLEDVTVMGKTIIDKLQETGFNVSAIDARPYHNSSTDLSKIIENAPGVKIRENGGLGSRTNININGMSGRHVRVFIDGMPLESMGSAFQINNLPINLAERIEVYKGVVPVNFGADALGGAINIVTKKNKGLYLDASYSYGSFCTHKSYVNASYTSKNGFMAQVNAFQNYSKNDYFVNVKIKDFKTNLLSKDKRRVRRFHDKYHNESIITKIGLVDKWYADRLLFGLTLGQEYDEIQHPAYLNIAFGEKYKTSRIIMPSIIYSKKNFIFNDLDVQFNANYNIGGGNNYDLSDKEYNWLGESRPSNNLGEIQYSNYVYRYNNWSINTNLKYKISSKHHFVFNSIMNLFSRKGNEKTDIRDYANLKPRVNNRLINGLSFNSNFSDKFSTSAFVKSYTYNASAYIDIAKLTNVPDFQTLTKNESLFGYGLTSTYFINNHFQVKANYELARRLPISRELFGEVFGFYVANFDLKPESSHNFNLGTIYELQLNENNFVSADVNLFYRYTKDFIHMNVNYSQGKGLYLNEDLVNTIGIDTDLRYSFKNRFSANANISYLSPKLYKEKSIINPSILPNIPTFFANANAIYVAFKNKYKKITISYDIQFINEFLYDYEIYKASNRAKIPTQWNHNLFFTYSWSKGKYNLSLAAKNILDSKLYDNYSLQKPGRSFSLKFRYFIQKNNLINNNYEN